MKFEVIFYEKPDGKMPAKDFLLSLNKKMRAKMLDMIVLLENNGNELREPYSKSVLEKAKRYREDFLQKGERK